MRPRVGILFVAVPGVKNLAYSYESDFLKLLQNAHAYIFSQGTLTQVCESHGFEAIYANENVEALFKIKNDRGNGKYPIKNYYDNIMQYLCQLGNVQLYDYSKKVRKVLEYIQQYDMEEVVIYGIGGESTKFMKSIDAPVQLRGFATRETDGVNEFLGYPIVDLEKAEGVKRVVIVSRFYADIIYERIKHMEGFGVNIISLYDAK